MNTAHKLYTNIPKIHNCAQAIVDGFLRNDLYEEMKKFGGGNAPNGQCGALYGALQLAPKEKHESMCQEFAKRAKSENCREIKTIHKTPCADCVAIAAEILENALKETN